MTTKGIPVVALTGHAMAGHSESAKSAGCDVVITKPCLPHDLIKEIQEGHRRAGQRVVGQRQAYERVKKSRSARPSSAGPSPAVARSGTARPSTRKGPRTRSSRTPRTSPRGPVLRWNPDPEDVQRSVVKLVLSLIEFIRKLMERQAIRRLEEKTLTPGEIENVGVALMKLEQTVHQIAQPLQAGPERSESGSRTRRPPALS